MERIAKQRNLPFMTAKIKAQQLYALDMKDDDFIEMAYDVWRSIGNIAPQITRYFTTIPDDFIVELPGDVEFIESVTQVGQQSVVTTFDSAGRKDRHIPAAEVASNLPRPAQSLSTSPGATINWVTAGDSAIKITSPDLLNEDLMIVYRSTEKDKDGLPILNDKEVAAIAAEVAKRDLIRKGFQGVGFGKNSPAQLMLQYITAEASRLMVAAKIDESITDDAIDKMMDLQFNWDRKQYGRRFSLLK